MRLPLLAASTLALATLAPAVSGQVSIAALNVAYVQNFNTTTASVPSGWSFVEVGSGANTAFGTGTGTSNTGNTYFFGSADEWAFGSLQSGSVATTIGVTFTNSTGVTISSLQIAVSGEQWRLGSTGRADRMDFSYQVGVSTVNASGTWTSVDALDISSVVTSGTAGALDGNVNSANYSATISGLSIAPGASFTLRWVDFDATSSDDGLAVDNFSITAIPEPAHVAAGFGALALAGVILARRRRA